MDGHGEESCQFAHLVDNFGRTELSSQYNIKIGIGQKFGLLYRAFFPVSHKVFKTMIWEIPPADWLIL